MSKGILPNDLIDNLEEASNLVSDNWFKNTMKYKVMASMLIKHTIYEYSNLTYEQIAALIIDKKPRNYKDIDELYSSEIDLSPGESGGTHGKDRTILTDLVFEIKRNPNPPIRKGGIIPKNTPKWDTNKVKLNFEVQGAPKDYSIIGRAIYYASRLLDTTLKKGDNYDKINKVYTIWLCNFKLDNELEQVQQVRNRAIHHIKPCRFYEDLGITFCDPVEDLMEAVMIELPKLKNQDDEFQRLIYTIMRDTTKAIEEIKRVAKIDLTKYKEVRGMFDMEQEFRDREARGVYMERYRLHRQLVTNKLKKGKSKLQVVQELIDDLDITKDEAIQIVTETVEQGAEK